MMLRHGLFYLLSLVLLGLLLALSHIYPHQWHWSQLRGDRLHPHTRNLLQQIDQPLRITVFMADFPVQRAAAREWLQRYQRHAPLIQWEFVNPARQPQRAEALGIRKMPHFLLQYQGRSQHLDKLDEASLSNAIARLLLDDSGWIVNLVGHGEQRLGGGDDRDLSRFAQWLSQQGYKALDLDLSQFGQIPRNTRLLLLASPQQALPEPAVLQIRQFIDQGGTLLWLADGHLPQPLSEFLGLDFLPGIIVDASAADVGQDSPVVAVARPASDHALVRQLPGPVLLPAARAFRIHPANGFASQILLRTGARSWNETGALQGSIERDPDAGEQPGPLTVAALLRQPQGGQALVLGDGHFLANAFIGQGGNKAFAQALIHWLTANHPLVDIPAREGAPDQRLDYSQAHLARMGLLWVIALPALLALTGLLISYLRRRA